MDVAGKLRALRKKAGDPKQEDVATASGLEQREYLSRMENGLRSPTVAELEALLRYYGTTLAEFFDAKLPARFAKQAHADLHEQLQAIMDRGDEKIISAVSFSLQTAYAALEGHERQKQNGKKGQ